MPGFSDEVEAVTKRTGEVMGTFVKNYLKAVVKQSLSDTMDGAMEEVVDELKDCALTITKGPKKEAEEKVDEAEQDVIVGAKIGGRSKEKDVDTSLYTAYSIVSCSISPTDSNLQKFNTRYRALLKLNKQLTTDLKNDYPEDLKFPPKRIFGNKEEKFLETRQHELSDWINRVSKTDKLAKSNDFMKGVKLLADENAEFNHGIFVDAFNDTCSDVGVNCQDDPDEFEDEGTGLIVLMLDVAEKEVMPQIEEKILALPAAKGVARKAARSAVASAIGKVVHKAWEAASEPVEKAKGVLVKQLNENQDVIKKILKTMLGKLTPVLVEKLAKKPAGELSEEEKQEFEPKAAQLPLAGHIIELATKEDKIVDALKKVQEEIKGQFKLKDNLNKQADKLLKDSPDPHITHVLNVMRDLVNGVADLWLRLVDSLLTGLVLVMKAREEFEEKIVASGSADAAKPEIEKLGAALKNGLRDFGLQLSSTFYKEQKDLKVNLRALSSTASSELRKTVLGVPQSMLNFLARYRLNLLKQLPSIFNQANADAGTLKQEYRRVFVESGLSEFDAFFGKSWVVMVGAVSEAAKQTLMEKLGEPAKPVVAEVMVEIEQAVQMPDGFDVSSVAGAVVDKVLSTIADTALGFAKKKLEMAVFVDVE